MDFSLHSKPRTNQELKEVRDVISQEYICKKGLSFVINYYPVIIDAINELIEKREKIKE